MVANCCPTLAAALFSHPEYKKLVQPEQQHKWQFVPIYDAMMNIESGPAYAQAAKEKKEMKASVAKSALAVQQQQQVNAMQSRHGSGKGPGQGSDKDSGKGSAKPNKGRDGRDRGYKNVFGNTEDYRKLSD